MDQANAEGREHVAPVWPRLINAAGIGMFVGAALASLSASVYWHIALICVAVILQLSGGVLLWRAGRVAAKTPGGRQPPRRGGGQ